MIFLEVYKTDKDGFSSIREYETLEDLIQTCGDGAADNVQVLREWEKSNFREPQCILRDCFDKYCAVIYIVGRINEQQ